MAAFVNICFENDSIKGSRKLGENKTIIWKSFSVISET
jgi:hypothetical protein